MGTMVYENGSLMSGHISLDSGFNGVYAQGGSKTDGLDYPEDKYYDKYSYSISELQYQRRILGDATGEMGSFISQFTKDTNYIHSWYNDSGHFTYYGYSFFVRSGGHSSGIYSGTFAFYRDSGHMTNWLSFRLILTPTL